MSAWQRKRKYLLIIIILLVIIGAGFLIYKYLWLANFWLEPWKYRKEIVIDNSKSQNLLENYPILIEINTSSLIEEGKLSSDCNDIRFTDSDKKTELSYWIDSGCNTIKTKVWVKVPEIHKNSNKKIYLYYGNSKSETKSNKLETTGIAAGEFTIKQIDRKYSLRSVTNCVRSSIGDFYCGFTEDDRTVYLMKSEDGGQSWKEVLAEESKTGSIGFSSIAIDSKDNIHLIWKNKEIINDPDDYSRLISSPYFQYLRITPGEERTEEILYDNDSFPGPFIAIDSKDNIHIVSTRKGLGENMESWNLQYQKKTVQGWQTPELITDEPLQQSAPYIKIDSKDILHIVWAGYDRVGKPIKYRTKDEDWSLIELISEDFSHNVWPYFDLDIDNNIHIAWSDYFIKYRKKINENLESIETVATGKNQLLCTNLSKDIYLFFVPKAKQTIIDVYLKQEGVSSWEQISPIETSSYPWFYSGMGATAHCLGMNWVKKNGIFNSMPRQGFALVYYSYTDNHREVKFYISENAVYGVAEVEPEVSINLEKTTIFNKIISFFN